MKIPIAARFLVFILALQGCSIYRRPAVPPAPVTVIHGVKQPATDPSALPDVSPQVSQARVVPLVSVPPYSSGLRGDNEVRFINDNDYPVLVAVRSGESGADLHLVAGESTTVGLPDGKFRLYIVFGADTEALYRGERFSLPFPSLLEIHIPKFIR